MRIYESGASHLLTLSYNRGMADFDSYQSPFTWRYASREMRMIWGEVHKRRLWRRVWLALAEAQAEFGPVTAEQVADIRNHVDDVDLSRALEIEAEIHHDLVAELKTFASQCTVGAGVLHLGATSTDIEDNAEALRIRLSMNVILEKLAKLLTLLADSIEQWAEIPLMGFTHLQPAEPSTLGYRFAQYGQDLLMDWDNLVELQAKVRGKGFKGAVGTGAAYAELVGVEKLGAFETFAMQLLGLEFYPVTSQTSPRKQEYEILSALAGLGGSLYKFAFDLRILQSPGFGEIREPFASRQVGSSAMPFKRNPIQAEKIDSLARALAQMPRLAWDNASHSLLERTLDDSANRRSMLPEAFLIGDELLEVSRKIVSGLRVDRRAINRNLDAYGAFASLERVLMALTVAGADRQAMHELLRQHAMTSWERVEAGEPNPLEKLVCGDRRLHRYLSAESLSFKMKIEDYIGDAPRRAKAMAESIRQRLAS